MGFDIEYMKEHTKPFTDPMLETYNKRNRGGLKILLSGSLLCDLIANTVYLKGFLRKRVACMYWFHSNSHIGNNVRSTILNTIFHTKYNDDTYYYHFFDVTFTDILHETNSAIHDPNFSVTEIIDDNRLSECLYMIDHSIYGQNPFFMNN